MNCNKPLIVAFSHIMFSPKHYQKHWWGTGIIEWLISISVHKKKVSPKYGNLKVHALRFGWVFVPIPRISKYIASPHTPPRRQIGQHSNMVIRIHFIPQKTSSIVVDPKTICLKYMIWHSHIMFFDGGNQHSMLTFFDCSLGSLGCFPWSMEGTAVLLWVGRCTSTGPWAHPRRCRSTVWAP